MRTLFFRGKGVSAWITNMVTQGAKITPQDSENGWILKASQKDPWQRQVFKQRQTHPYQQSTSQQLGGRRQGRRLKIRRTPPGGAGRVE
jgi:hypothetical protein